MQTSANIRKAALSRDGYGRAKPLDTQKRIGSTVYITLVHTRVQPSNLIHSAAETIEEKIMRLVRNDLNTPAGHVNINVPQTGRLAERGSA